MDHQFWIVDFERYVAKRRKHNIMTIIQLLSCWTIHFVWKLKFTNCFIELPSLNPLLQKSCKILAKCLCVEWSWAHWVQEYHFGDHRPVSSHPLGGEPGQGRHELRALMEYLELSLLPHTNSDVFIIKFQFEMIIKQSCLSNNSNEYPAFPG